MPASPVTPAGHWTLEITHAATGDTSTAVLGRAAGVKNTFSGRALQNGRLFDASLQVGQFTCTRPVQKIEDPPLCEFGDAVNLYDPNGVIRFTGRRVAAIGSESGPAAHQHYRFVNAWWDLTKRIYHQAWTIWRTNSGTGLVESYIEYNPHLILNAGSRTVELEIRAIIDYAAAQGVNIASGNIYAPVTPPPDEVINRDCASVISQLMSFAPGNVCWLQYRRGLAPLFHCLPAEYLTAATVDAFGPNGSEDLTIEARHEDVASAVALRYERTDQFTENDVTTERPVIVTDIYPTDATGREERAVSETIQLAGFRASEVTAQLLCASFPGSNTDADFETTAAVDDFWSRPIFNLPVTDTRIGRLPADRVTVTPGSFVRSAAQSDEDESPTLTVLPRYIIAGTPAPWMEISSGTALTWQKQVVSALFNWTLFDDTLHETYGTIEKVSGKRLPVYLTATDAPEGLSTYRTQTAFEEGEQPPVGLAQYLYTHLSVLGYQGQRRRIQTECDGSIGLGHMLNLSGGLPAWASMNALVQSVDEDIDNGTTTLNFGVAPGLSLGRILELLRTARTRRRWTAVAQRDDGTIGDSAGVELGETTADTNTVPGLEKLTYYAVKDGDQKVSIDATNRVIIIEKAGRKGYVSASASDDGSIVRCNGGSDDTDRYAIQEAGALYAGHRATGVGGGYDLSTANLGNTNTARWRLVNACHPDDPAGTYYARYVACTARFAVGARIPRET